MKNRRHLRNYPLDLKGKTMKDRRKHYCYLVSSALVLGTLLSLWGGTEIVARSVGSLSRTELARHLQREDQIIVVEANHRQLFTKTSKNNNNNNNNKGPLFLVLGLPYSGSIGLHNFFVCHEMSSAHYCCDGSSRTQFPCPNATCGGIVWNSLQQNQPPFANNIQVITQFDVESSEPFAWFLPQHYLLPVLHQMYPNAVWILNERSSAATWARHVAHWYSASVRLLHSFGRNYHAPRKRPPDNTPLAPFRTFRDRETRLALNDAVKRAWNKTLHTQRLRVLEEIYRNHSEWVTTFAKKVGHTLVRVNVDQGVEALSSVLPNYQAQCWTFDAVAYSSDWKNLSLQF